MNVHLILLLFTGSAIPGRAWCEPPDGVPAHPVLEPAPAGLPVPRPGQDDVLLAADSQHPPPLLHLLETRGQVQDGLRAGRYHCQGSQQNK